MRCGLPGVGRVMPGGRSRSPYDAPPTWGWTGCCSPATSPTWPRPAPSSATAGSTRTPGTARAATGSRPASVRDELGPEEPQHPHEVVGIDHRRVHGERRHAAAREQDLPPAPTGAAPHLDVRVGAREVEDEAVALPDHLELTLVDLELGRRGARADRPHPARGRADAAGA